MSRAVAVGIAVRGTLVCIAAAIAIAAGGCGGGGGAGGNGAGNSNNNNPGPDVTTRTSASLGKYLVAADGRTLYYFGLDLPGGAGNAPVSNCTGSCVPLWPVFHVTSPVLAP